MKITLDDVVGLEHHKNIFKEALFLKKENQNLYNELIKDKTKIKERKNFLLTGPSGSGKTYLVNAIANECNIKVIALNGADLFDKFVGEGEKRLREVYIPQGEFIVTIDEAEDTFKERKDDIKTNGLVNQMLYCMDGGFGNYEIITILMSNKPAIFDKSIISRIPLHHRLYFPKPDSKQKQMIFEKQLSYHNHEENLIPTLLNLTEDWDSRNIEDLFAYARNNALKNKRNYLAQEDFQEFFRRDTTYEWKTQ
ncbi:MAG: ATP-binding protein [Candidatus Woesearchaeota archaeon]